MGVTECRTWAKDAMNHAGLKSTFSFVNTFFFGFVHYLREVVFCY